MLSSELDMITVIAARKIQQDLKYSIVRKANVEGLIKNRGQKECKPVVIYDYELFDLTTKMGACSRKLYKDTYRKFKDKDLRVALRRQKNLIPIYICGHPLKSHGSWVAYYFKAPGGKTVLGGVNPFRTFCNYYNIEFHTTMVEQWGVPLSTVHTEQLNKAKPCYRDLANLIIDKELDVTLEKLESDIKELWRSEKMASPKMTLEYFINNLSIEDIPV